MRCLLLVTLLTSLVLLLVACASGQNFATKECSKAKGICTHWSYCDRTMINKAYCGKAEFVCCTSFFLDPGNCSACQRDCGGSPVLEGPKCPGNLKCCMSL